VAWNAFKSRVLPYAEAVVRSRFRVSHPDWDKIPKEQRATPDQVQWAADVLRWQGQYGVAHNGFSNEPPPEYLQMAERILQGYDPYRTQAATPQPTPPAAPQPANAQPIQSPP
jgi:hypothetical protein